MEISAIPSMRLPANRHSCIASTIVTPTTTTTLLFFFFFSLPLSHKSNVGIFQLCLLSLCMCSKRFSSFFFLSPISSRSFLLTRRLLLLLPLAHPGPSPFLFSIRQRKHKQFKCESREGYYYTAGTLENSDSGGGRKRRLCGSVTGRLINNVVKGRERARGEWTDSIASSPFLSLSFSLSFPIPTCSV